MTDDDCPATDPNAGTGDPPEVVAAKALVGLAAPSQEYADAVCPGGSPERQREAMAASGCALLWLAQNGGQWTGDAFADMWRLLGHSPWNPGGRVRVPVRGELPAIGVAVVYGPGPGGPAHVDDFWLGNNEAVAGGQRVTAKDLEDGIFPEGTVVGAECIKKVTRQLTWGGGHLVDLHTGRPVIALVAPA